MRGPIAALVLAAAVVALRADALAPTPFAAGERVALFGDSITHAAKYGWYLQLFADLRHPGSGTCLMNVGQNGDSARGALGRMTTDLLPKKPTRVFCMFGMNDVGRSLYATTTPDATTVERRERALAAYAQSVPELVRRLRAAGATPVLMTPSPYDQYTEGKGEWLKACNDPGLARCAGIVRQVAATQEVALVDLYCPLTALMRANLGFRFCHDRIHPGDVGHLAIAGRILQAMGVPPSVAETRVAANRPDGASFVHAPKALPFPKLTEYETLSKMDRTLADLNREIVAVTGLSPGTYALSFEGAELGRYTAEELAAGVDVATLATTNQCLAQAAAKAMYEARGISSRLREYDQLANWVKGAGIDENDFVRADAHLGKWLKSQERSPHIGAFRSWYKTYLAVRAERPRLLARTEELRRTMAAVRPVACRAELRRVSRASVIAVKPGVGTLEKGLAAVRARIAAGGGNVPEGGLVLELDDGVYPVAKTLEVTGAESGCAGAPVTIRARHRGQAIVTGALTLGPWKPVTDPAILARLPEASRARVVMCMVPGDGPLSGFRGGGCIRRQELSENPVQLFQSDHRLACARWPKREPAYTGFPLGQVIPSLKTCDGRMYDGGVFMFDSPRLAAWAKEPDLWATGQWFYEWSNTVAPVEKVDLAARSLTVDMLQNRFGVKYGAPFHVLNALCEMSEPGDWVVDRAKRTIYLLPIADPKTAPVTMARASSVFHAKGWRHGVIDGLVFEMSFGNGVILSDPADVTVRASCVRHVGGTAVQAARAWRTRIVGCDLYDIGRDGIALDGGDRLSLTPGSNVVENCHIRDYGVIVPNYTPGVGVSGCGNRVMRNLVHHGAHQAFLFGGNDNYLGYNVIHDVCRNCDAGAIYCCTRDPTQRGNVVECNIIHMSGKQPRCSHTNGIYLDDYSAGMTVRSNIVNRASMGIYVGGGSQNRVTDNLILNTPHAFCLGSRDVTSWCSRMWVKDGTNGLLCVALDRHRDIFTNATWTAHYPDMLRPFGFADPTFAYNALWNVISNNVAVGVTKGFTCENEKVIAPYTVMADNVVRADDPGFVDYPHFDWRLRDGMPLRTRLGAFPLGRTGLYASDDRFSPAVRFAANVTPPRPIRPEPTLAEMNFWVERVGRGNDRSQVFFTEYRGCEPPDKSAGHALKGWYGPAAPSTGDWRTYEFAFTPTFDGQARMVFAGGPGEKTDVRNVRVSGVEGFRSDLFPTSVTQRASAFCDVTVKTGVRVTGRYEARAARLDEEKAAGDVLARMKPVWDLADHGGARKIAPADPLRVPHTAIPNAKAFTVRAVVTFGTVEEGHALMLFDQILSGTGFGLELIRQNSWGNPMFLHCNGEKYYCTYPVGRIKSGSTHAFTVAARRGWIVVYMDDKPLQRFIMNVTPNLDDIKVPGVIRPRWDTRQPWLEMPDVTLDELKFWGDDVEYYAPGEPRDVPTGFKGGRGWLVETPTHPIPGKPNVLYVGDSISDAYSKFFREATKGRANVYHYNTCFAAPGAGGVKPYLPRWREVGALAPFDHIVVNNGLHSLHWTPEKVSDDHVRDSYREIFNLCRAAAPKAKVHYALTTPYTAARGADGKVTGLGDRNAVVLRLNRIASEEMRAQGADLIDLYSTMAARLELAVGDQYHWKPEGSRLIAETIADALGIRVPAK